MSLFLYVPSSVALVVLLDLLLKNAVIQTDLLIGTIIPILLCPPVTYVFARMAQRLDETESVLLKTSQTDSYRLRYLDAMDRISQISTSSEDIDDVLGGILDLVLEVFHADRAWFLFPCDPDALAWTVPIERTRPEWPGLFALGKPMPMQADVAQAFRDMLKASGVIQYGPLTSRTIPPEVAEQFSIKSQMQVTLRPKTGQPWVFGLHHCSQAVLHDDEDSHLFSVIAQRISDTLGSLISIKQLRENEQHLRYILEISPIAVRIARVGGREVIFANKRYGDLINAEFTQVIGADPRIYYSHPEDYEGVLRQLAEGGQVFNRLVELTIPGYGPKWALASYLLVQYEGGDAVLGWFYDITERKQAEEQLKLSARVFAEAHEGISITDASGAVIDVNPMFCEITGYSREEIVGKNLRILKSNKHPPEFYAAIWRSLAEEGYWQGEVWNVKKNGVPYIELLSISALRNEQGEIIHYIGLFSDITKTKQQQQSLEMMAHYDALTQLPNRVLFADRFNQSIARARRDKSLLAVCYLDLDGFKQVNDTLGHEAGDSLLVEVAGRIKTTLREEDTVSRLGGDEFGFLLGDMSTLEQCEQTLDRIHQAIAMPYQINGQEVIIGASTGVTLYPQDDADPDTLLRHADQTMYQAKLQGRNRYFFFDSTQDQQVQQHRNQLHTIEDAFSRHEFCLYYQPKVNMRTGQVIGAEALIRWNHPERGVLPPFEFLPVISGTHMDNILGNWVMQEALNQLGLWHKSGINIQVSINISPRHLQSPGFYAELDAALARHPDVYSRKLELEVLESSAVDNLAEISRVIDECFNLLGVPFALDDFGTGYSSLTHMRHLQASTVKIDQSFVRDMVDDPDDFAIVEGVIGLSKAFRREVIAEGVETIAHGQVLIGMDCPLAQGYAIARPMPAEALPEWILAWKTFKEWQKLDPEKVGAETAQFLILHMELDQWFSRMEESLSGENTAEDQWPVYSKNKCHLGRWIIRAKRNDKVDLDRLANLEQSHEELHRIADELRYKYQGGKLEEARNGIKRLRATYQVVGTILRQIPSL